MFDGWFLRLKSWRFEPGRDHEALSLNARREDQQELMADPIFELMKVDMGSPWRLSNKQVERIHLIFVLTSSSLRLMIEPCVCNIERVSTHPFSSTSSCLSRAVVMRCVDNSWPKKMPDDWLVPSSIALVIYPFSGTCEEWSHLFPHSFLFASGCVCGLWMDDSYHLFTC